MSQAPFAISNPALVAIMNDYSAVNARDRGYIADRVIPRVSVEAPLFKYATFPIEEAFTLYDNQIGRTGQLNEIVQSATEAADSVLDYGLLQKVPYRDEAAARLQSAGVGFSWKARAARNVVDKNQLAREVRAANILFSPSSYMVGYKATLTGTSQWSDYANSDPVTAIKTARRGMLMRPNVAVMSEKVRDILSQHPKLSVAAGGSQDSGRVLTDQEIARVLGFERIEVANTLRQTSVRGQTLSTGYIWGDHFAMIYIPSVGADGRASAGADMPAFALTFQWMGNVAGENLYRPGEYGLLGGVGVYAGEMLKEKQVAPFAGYLFTNAVA